MIGADHVFDRYPVACYSNKMGMGAKLKRYRVKGNKGGAMRLDKAYDGVW